MQNFIYQAKVTIYTRQIYLGEATRGIVFVLLLDIIMAVWLKRIEQKCQRTLQTAPAPQRI